jgi:radical SAM superfamily enzyme YgiQ (UPF0313 family)
VIDEIEWLINKYKFKSVYFDDDTFNIDKGYVKEICNYMKERKINIPWAVMARPDIMERETLEKMKKSGLYAIKYGIESGSQKILNRCGKNMDLNKAKEVIRFTKKLGVKVHPTFCIGLPGETQATIGESLDFLFEINPDSVQFSIATPFPGTEFFKYMRERGYLTSFNWSVYDGNYIAVIRVEDLSSSMLERELVNLRLSWEEFKINKKI